MVKKPANLLHRVTRISPAFYLRSLCAVAFLFVSAFPIFASDGHSTEVTKKVSFSILEDYDKGADLSDVALDFELMNQLGIDQLRCSFGWDDYEPARGVYDFDWLKQFVALAARYNIKLRPYLAYTAPWAGVGGHDDSYWNDPPAEARDWSNFVRELASALKDYPNVLSYEIYNEENDSVWWEGNVHRYAETLKQAALAVRAVNPKIQLILGGFVFPDDDWLLPIVDWGYSRYYDITPFHAYPETWEKTSVESYLDTQYYDYFVPHNRQGGNQPIWVNEMGFATTKGRTEDDQANWFARAISTFLADAYIQHLGFYEIKDLPRGHQSIGGAPNYHLGLTYKDRTPKLAFYSITMMMDLLNVGSLTTADSEAEVKVTDGTGVELYHHLFRRPDGSQVLFVYDKKSDPTVEVTLERSGSEAYKYELNNTFSPYQAFDGKRLEGISLVPRKVAIFLIKPKRGA